MSRSREVRFTLVAGEGEGLGGMSNEEGVGRAAPSSPSAGEGVRGGAAAGVERDSGSRVTEEGLDSGEGVGAGGGVVIEGPGGGGAASRRDEVGWARTRRVEVKDRVGAYIVEDEEINDLRTRDRERRGRRSPMLKEEEDGEDEG